MNNYGTDNLYVDEHLEKYFREVTFAENVNNNTERFHALFVTNIAPFGTHQSKIKDGTGSTERSAYVVTTDESVYFIARLSYQDCLSKDGKQKNKAIMRI